MFCLINAANIAAALKPSTILAYARLLAPYTSAPPRMKSISGNDDKDGGQSQTAQHDSSIPPGGIPPYPTEDVMRRGRLAFAQVHDIGETTALTGGRAATFHLPALCVGFQTC